MCGRFYYIFSWERILRLLTLVRRPEDELPERYNVAPTQDAPVALLDERGERVGAMLRWGLVPSWASDPSVGSKMINARSETAHELPAFRDALARRRCLAPISGFYEWKAVPGSKRKQPYRIGRADREPFALAGLWESWRKGGRPVDTFTILTTQANDLLRPLHERMPVILAPSDYDVWLDPRVTDASSVRHLLRPHQPDGMEIHPVSARVNSPSVDDASLLERANDQADRPTPAPRQATLWGDGSP